MKISSDAYKTEEMFKNITGLTKLVHVRPLHTSKFIRYIESLVNFRPILEKLYDYIAKNQYQSYIKLNIELH